MFDTMGNPVVLFDILDLSTRKPLDVDCSDLRQSLESFEYDENLDKVGELVMTFNNENGHLDDDERFRGEDKLIRFRWGYLTHLSPEKTAIVQYVLPDYPASGLVKLKVIAWDAVSWAYRRAHPMNWGRTATTEIARQVALRWGLNPIIPVRDDDVREKAYVQPGNISDLQYIKVLAKQRGWECWSDGTDLFFGPDNYSAKPVLSATYRNGMFSTAPGVAPVVLLSFKPDIDHGKQPSTRQVSIDPRKKQTSTHRSDDADAVTDSASTRKNLQQYMVGLDSKVLVNTSIPAPDFDAGAGKVIPTPEPSKEQVKKDTQAHQWKIARKASKASATFSGNPELRVMRIVEILGVSEIHAGKWKIQQVKHKISATGGVYETSCSLKRPGKGKGKASEKASNENKQTAPADVADLAPLVKALRVLLPTKTGTIVTRTQQ